MVFKIYIPNCPLENFMSFISLAAVNRVPYKFEHYDFQISDNLMGENDTALISFAFFYY